MRGWLTWIAAGAVGACYAPRSPGDCEVICGAASDGRCPDGFTCGTSGLCSISGAACAGDRGNGSCFGTGIAKPCVPAVPRGSLQVSGMLDTDTDAACVVVDQPVPGPPLCVIASERIAITGPVRAVGARPLVLVASEAISVDFPLEAGSHRAEAATGAGAAPCPSGVALSEGGIGAGGAGGSFHGSGGTGAAATGVPATMPLARAAFPDHVRGGCNGGAGASGTSLAGNPGAGGGALYLIAGQRIDVQSVISADGAGAYLEPPEVGARAGGGGGGGGSGGLIVLDAPVIALGGTARLIAVGGAGAGGGGTAPSQAGADPDPAAPFPIPITAVGGAGGLPDGGKGGSGSSPASIDGADGVDGTMEGGGGGGGGGAGFIQLRCTTCPPPGAVIVPPATP